MVMRVRTVIGFGCITPSEADTFLSEFSGNVTESLLSSSNGVSSTAFCNLRKVSRNTAGKIIKKPR